MRERLRAFAELFAAQRFVNFKFLFYAQMLIVDALHNAPINDDAKIGNEAPKRKRDVRNLIEYQAQQPSFSDDYQLVAFALLLYLSSSACRLLSDVIRGDRGQFVILGDTWKYKGADVRYVMRRETADCNIQAWRCVRMSNSKHCTAAANSGELRLAMGSNNNLSIDCSASERL